MTLSITILLYYTECRILFIVYPECRNAEFCHAECRYAEISGASWAKKKSLVQTQAAKAKAS
jgi:hypothetical protein